MKKNRIPFIILLLSFLPYVCILAHGIFCAVAGYDVYTMILPTYVRTIYGIDAFAEVIFTDALLLTVYPLLPICLFYQIGYGTAKFVTHIKNKKSKNT